ncbi:hypothetical protein ACEPPZ_03785 [Paracoccus yeei]|uniref:hypothetical protein n=1 Tax=Paracoccus yeei TaxID=147645 RepID=UPI0028D327D4|nr:hypothetical protein [Paracoccus yeei]
MFRIVATCLAGLVLALPAVALDLSAPAARLQLEAPPGAVAREFIRGPRGGCYYINGNGNKTYVDRGKCR